MTGGDLKASLNQNHLHIICPHGLDFLQHDSWIWGWGIPEDPRRVCIQKLQATLFPPQSKLVANTKTGGHQGMCGRVLKLQQYIKENLVLCYNCWPLGLPYLPEIWVSKSFVRVILAQVSKEQR